MADTTGQKKRIKIYRPALIRRPIALATSVLTGKAARRARMGWRRPQRCARCANTYTRQEMRGGVRWCLAGGHAWKRVKGSRGPRALNKRRGQYRSRQVPSEPITVMPADGPRARGTFGERIRRALGL